MSEQTAYDIMNPNQLEVKVGALVSRVPELLAARGWSALDLVRRGLTYNTAYRIARGDTDVTAKTLCQLVDIFELESISQVLVYLRDNKQETGK